MIRRILVFLLLLGAGITALVFAVGKDDLTRTQPPVPVAGPGGAPPSEPGVRVQGAGMEVGHRIVGAFRINPTRPVQRGEVVEHLPIYQLECRDSAPVGDGMQRLDGVTVALFDGPQHVADLTAERALVALGRDERGQTSIREDKDVHLEQAVLTSRPGGDLPPVRVELALARLRLLDQEVQLFTPTDDDPVRVAIAGDRPAQLTGRGLQARLPRDLRQQLQRLDLVVARDAVFAADQGTIRCRGPMELVQDLAAGAGELTANQAVQLELNGAGALPLPGPAGGADPGGVLVQGDRLKAWLRHGRGGRDRPVADGSLSWSLLQLDGAPATAQGRGTTLRGPRLTVLPTSSGTPYHFIVSGGPCQLTQDARSTAGPGVSFTAERRAHWLRPGMPAAAACRSLGFPAWTLGQLERLEVTTFVGRSHADSGDGVEVQAERGLRVVRPDGTDGLVISRGEGPVEIRRREDGGQLTARGDDGFLLRRGPDGERLQLGPEDPAAAAAHRFVMQRGDLAIQGTGTCLLTRQPPDTVLLSLRSARSDIGGELGGARGSFAGAEAVDLRLQGETVVACDVTGPEVRGTLLRGTEVASFTARQVVQEGTDGWRLLGSATTPARVQRRGTAAAGGLAAEAADLSAPVLRLFQLGRRSGWLLAEGNADQRVHLRAGPDRDGRTVTVAADTVRLLPFALPRSVVDAHLGGLAAGLAWLPGHDLTRPWLIARGNVATAIERAEERVDATSAVLVLAGQSQSALLVGDPDSATSARIERTEAAGRSMLGVAPRIRVGRAAGDSLTLLPTFPGRSTELPPVLVLRDPARQRGDGLGNLSGTCRGAIEVLPDRVLFQGPVRAQALDPAGQPDPVGMRVAAEELRMIRRPDTGEVLTIEARAGVQLDWSRIGARSSELTVDLLRSTCTVTDPVAAEVILPNGLRAQARHIVANYQTRALRWWHGRMSYVPPAAPEPPPER